MTITEYLMLGLAQYGLPVVCGVVLLASIGLPLPATLLLLTAGTLVAQGELHLVGVIGLATGAAVLGDLIGYMIGRWGSRRAIDQISHWAGGAHKVAQAEQMAQRWGGIGIFLSRWLLTPIGPVINLSSGMARYSWRFFVGFDVLGELVWVTGYVLLGWLLSDQIVALSSAISGVTWLIVGGLAVAVLGRWLWQHARPLNLIEQM